MSADPKLPPEARLAVATEELQHAEEWARLHRDSVRDFERLELDLRDAIDAGAREWIGVPGTPPRSLVELLEAIREDLRSARISAMTWEMRVDALIRECARLRLEIRGTKPGEPVRFARIIRMWKKGGGTPPNAG